MGVSIDVGGRRALVTGGGQGIGRAIALTLAEAGASVVVNDVVPANADAVVAEITAAGGTASPLPFDVTSWDDVATAVDGGGPVDVLVNNAGNAGTAGFGREDLRDFADTEPDDWWPFFAVNLFGTMHCTRAVLPGMIASGHGGRVITIVSDAARHGDAKVAPYAAAKAGAAGFCRSVAREVGKHGITVNCISLGTMQTPATADGVTGEALERLVRPYVVRRRGRPEEVANLVAYLASPMAEWITGQTYALNGGYTFSL
jgi:3-oxoacyl-[acyl-carrier protein] reductase